VLHRTIDPAALNPGQLKFARSTDREVLLSGGYGAGKTLGLSVKFLLLRSANYPAPGIVVAPNWRTMWAVTYRRIMATLRKVYPKSRLPILVDKQQECYLDFRDGGGPIYLRSANNVDGYDGIDVGWGLGDECRYWSDFAYRVLQGRIRVKCAQPQLALVTTPAMGWLSDEFNSGKKNRELIIAPTRENAHNLAPGFIDNLKLSYSPRLWRALIEGIFTILEGAVYEDFDPLPTSPWFVDFEPSQRTLADKVYIWADPGYRRSSWIFVAKTGRTEWTAFDQCTLDNKTDQQAVAEINAKGYPIDEIWIDVAAGNTQSYEGANTLKAVRGIKCRTRAPLRMLSGANREIPFGVDKTRVLLGNAEDPGPIRLKFARSLAEGERGKARGVIKSLASYRYPEIKDGRAVTDHPLKDGKYDHCCDAVRYGAVGMWASEPALRRLDPQMSANRQPGYRSTA
jgi:hypothetical protein